MPRRMVVAAAVLVSAAVTASLVDGVRDQSWSGVPAQRGRWPSSPCCSSRGGMGAAVAAGGFGPSMLGAFTISATVGLFGVHEHWTGGYVWTAAVAEAVAVVGGVVVPLREVPGQHLEEGSRGPVGRRRRLHEDAALRGGGGSGQPHRASATARHVPTCWVRPSRVRTNRPYLTLRGIR